MSGKEPNSTVKSKRQGSFVHRVGSRDLNTETKMTNFSQTDGCLSPMTRKSGVVRESMYSKSAVKMKKLDSEDEEEHEEEI